MIAERVRDVWGSCGLLLGVPVYKATVFTLRLHSECCSYAAWHSFAL